MGAGDQNVSKAQISQALTGLAFPVNKNAILAHARQNQPDKDVHFLLEQLPDQDYESLAELMEAVSNFV